MPMPFPLPELRELALTGLRPAADAAATGSTEAGPLRLEWYAPGIARLRIGSTGLPDYGLLAAAADPPAVALEEGEGRIELRLKATSLPSTSVAIEAAAFAVTLVHQGTALLGPATDGHFRRRFRLPRFATT